MAAGSDNVFPKLITAVQATDISAPSDGSWKIYSKAGGIYARSSNSVVGPFGAASGGGITSGTSNPGSPSDGDLFYRSDLSIIIRYHSAQSHWRCTCPHDMAEGPQVATIPTSSNASVYLPVPALTFGTHIYLTSLNVGAFVVTTNNGSNFWTFTVTAPAWTSATVNTSAGAANTELILRYTTAFDWTFNAAGWMEVTYVKTSAPGTLYHMVSYSYRYIVP